MKDIVIIGVGGFGREVAEAIKDVNKKRKTWRIKGFLDEDDKLYNKKINGYLVLGNLEWLKKNKDVYCVVAIGDPKTKEDIVNKVGENSGRFVSIIHPSVIMSDFVEIGEGTIICAGSILTTNIQIGKHVIINLNCTIGHDVKIGDYSSIMPDVSINGEDIIGESVYIGTNASLKEAVEIGEKTVIGAGSVVINDMPKNVTAVGVPAKVIKKNQ